MRQQRRLLAQHFVRTQQQFGEIDQPGATATFFVGGVDADKGLRNEITAGLDVLGAPAFILLGVDPPHRSEEHTSELPSLMRISYAVLCLKQTKLKRRSYVFSHVSKQEK